VVEGEVAIYLLFVWGERWHERRQRRSHVKRGKSYWDAILAEDSRKQGGDSSLADLPDYGQILRLRTLAEAEEE
jgi:hypothetical protein